MVLIFDKKFIRFWRRNFVIDSQLNSAFYVTFYVVMSNNNLEDILPASKNIAWCIVIEEQIEINDLKSPFDDWHLKFRKTKFNKNIFMERLMSVIMLILNIICFVYRCNTLIACINWISELIRFMLYDDYSGYSQSIKLCTSQMINRWLIIYNLWSKCSFWSLFYPKMSIN